MKTIHLQSIGKVPATEAKNIKPGGKIMYNFGYKYNVLSIEKETEKSIVVNVQSVEGGKIYSQRFMKERLVCFLN